MRELLSIIESTLQKNVGYIKDDNNTTSSPLPISTSTSKNDSDSGYNEVPLSSLTHVFIVMGAIYGVLLFAPLIQFIRIYLTGHPLRKMSTQKTFLVLLFLTCTFRTIFFFSVALSDNDGTTFNIGKFSKEKYTILDDLGCISFFTTFCLLILFWIEIVYHSRNKTKLYQRKVKPLFFLAIGIIYILQIIIWILIFAIPKTYREQVDKADNTFYAAISLLASLAFLYYGVNLSLKLKRNPIRSRGQRKKVIEVVVFTVLCTICFLGRSLLFLVVSYYPRLHVNFTSVAIYYVVSEVVLSIFVVILFRKLPPNKNNVTPTYRISTGGSTTYIHSSNINNNINSGNGDIKKSNLKDIQDEYNRDASRNDYRRINEEIDNDDDDDDIRTSLIN